MRRARLEETKGLGAEKNWSETTRGQLLKGHVSHTEENNLFQRSWDSLEGFLSMKSDDQICISESSLLNSKGKR